MNSKNTEITYKQAIEELEQIVNEIESGELDLDDLLKKVDRAATLILYCKEKLKNSETKFDEVMKKLESNNN
ncbi:MAG: hypothetical protein KatS3mg027_2018 [Bacteroidia bacterium]|nr:MAG: hypothetical protein KatS3mg027_2018 [Bacteroidia bacterium]